MRYPAEWGRFFVAKAAVAALAVLVVWGAPTARSQAQGPAAQSPAVPQWQTAAGGKMAFDVTSVKQDTADPSTARSNVPLDPTNVSTPSGGLLAAANFPLPAYIAFAYKLNEAEMHAVQSQLPEWANTNRYDIQAKAEGNPTKDQMRLMMQALLADRFKLAFRYETRQVPVFALVLDKPGKLGPQLRLHSDAPPCSSVPTPGPAPEFSTTVSGGFPQICGVITPVQPSAPGRIRPGARSVPVAMFASAMNVGATGVDRPVLDKTGLIGKFDFVIEFTPQFNGPVQPGSIQPDPTGPTFLEALKDQLGLKLVPQTGAVDVLVIDHVERPSEN